MPFDLEDSGYCWSVLTAMTCQCYLEIKDSLRTGRLGKGDPIFKKRGAEGVPQFSGYHTAQPEKSYARVLGRKLIPTVGPHDVFMD